MCEMSTCPRCFGTYIEYCALSRRDNETAICPHCGICEALEDAGLMRKWETHTYWKKHKGCGVTSESESES